MTGPSSRSWSQTSPSSQWRLQKIKLVSPNGSWVAQGRGRLRKGGKCCIFRRGGGFSWGYGFGSLSLAELTPSSTLFFLALPGWIRCVSSSGCSSLSGRHGTPSPSGPHWLWSARGSPGPSALCGAGAGPGAVGTPAGSRVPGTASRRSLCLQFRSADGWQRPALFGGRSAAESGAGRGGESRSPFHPPDRGGASKH